MKEKILIALSDETLATHLADKLSAEGYIPNVVQNGDEVLESMKVDAPDLLVIDLVLPGGRTGYDVLEEKTLDRLVTKIPVIIVSNSGNTIEMKRIPASPSIKDYVIKAHVSPEEIILKISALFQHHYDPHTSAADQGSKKAAKKILWVEDDKFLSNILKKKFESSGHVVLKAEDGEGALKILETEVPDVIVLDILLPGMSGFDIVQKIKMNEKFRRIPVYMLSNMNKPSDIEKAKVLGVQKFLVKAAVSLDEIVKEIE